MKRFNIFLCLLLAAVMLCGCGKKEKTDTETVTLTVFEDGTQLPVSGYDMMITVDGEEITADKTDNGYIFEKKSGEIRGTVKFSAWVEVEYGFVNDGSYSDVNIKLSFEHLENSLVASQTVTAKKNGEAVELSQTAQADVNDSQLSVFVQ